MTSIAKTRELLETSLFALSEDDRARRLVVDDRYWKWVRDWHTMPAGFQKAGRLIANRLQSSDFDFDYLFAVMVFLYRHALELQLKAVRQSVLLHLGQQPERPREHRLLVLWDEVEGLLNAASTPAAWWYPADPSTIRKRIAELDRLDHGGTLFRYPDGHPPVAHDDVVGVGNLADVLDAVLASLDGLVTGFHERRSMLSDSSTPANGEP